ncbi:hypothetical protein Ciccas_003834 [Cichlidogyrus casuarinus]|uniref:Uncharacterized protein n=1 Tax=Cichlidogyrus casuarinus TaxID=1844966 RepID=A0ABD2QDB6_9PLAT
MEMTTILPQQKTMIEEVEMSQNLLTSPDLNESLEDLVTSPVKDGRLVIAENSFEESPLAISQPLLNNMRIVEESPLSQLPQHSSNINSGLLARFKNFISPGKTVIRKPTEREPSLSNDDFEECIQAKLISADDPFTHSQFPEDLESNDKCFEQSDSHLYINLEDSCVFEAHTQADEFFDTQASADKSPQLIPDETARIISGINAVDPDVLTKEETGKTSLEPSIVKSTKRVSAIEETSESLKKNESMAIDDEEEKSEDGENVNEVNFASSVLRPEESSESEKENIVTPINSSKPFLMKPAPQGQIGLCSINDNFLALDESYQTQSSCAVSEKKPVTPLNMGMLTPFLQKSTKSLTMAECSKLLPTNFEIKITEFDLADSPNLNNLVDVKNQVRRRKQVGP